MNKKYFYWLIAIYCLLLVSCTQENNEVNNKPNPRYFHSMVYSENPEQVFIFGGVDEDNQVLDETWVYSNETWKKIDTSVSPPPLYGASLTFDPNRNKVVLFGGYNEGGLHNETWEFDGDNWYLINTKNSPAPRMNSAMSYSPFIDKIVLYSGSKSGEPVADTWLYDGQDWVQASLLEVLPNNPLPSMSSTFVSSQEQQGLLLISQLKEDIYVYDGDWRKSSMTLPLTPIPRFFQMSSNSDTLYYFYASGAQDTIDVWKYESSEWINVNTDVKPVSRKHHTIVYDSQREVYVMFGGVDPDGKVLNELWEFDGVTWTQH